MTTYLLPTTMTQKNVPIEYRVVTMKKDMRKSFCKLNDKYIINPLTLLKAAEIGFIVKNDRLKAPNGHTAYRFFKKLNLK